MEAGMGLRMGVLTRLRPERMGSCTGRPSAWETPDNVRAV